MRLFIAADPSDEMKRAAEKAAADLRRRVETKLRIHGARWIRRENLHLTVWFLGEVRDERAAVIVDAFRPALTEQKFLLRLSGLGAFPPSGSPRVLWMGVAAGLEALARIHREVGARLQPLGFQPEGRPYSAHLTLARLKEPVPSRSRAALRQLLQRSAAAAGECTVDALTLYRSRTAPTGAVYEPLLRVPLS